MYTRPLPLEPSLQLPTDPTPLGCHRALGWASCMIQQLPTCYLLYTCLCICFNATLSICPTLFFPHCVHKSVLYVCASIAALQIGTSVSFFYIPYVCVNIWYLLFSFWLTSLCITGSRFIHLTRTHSNSFLLWLSNIPFCICTTTSFSIHLLMDI